MYRLIDGYRVWRIESDLPDSDTLAAPCAPRDQRGVLYPPRSTGPQGAVLVKRPGQTTWSNHRGPASAGSGRPCWRPPSSSSGEAPPPTAPPGAQHESSERTVLCDGCALLGMLSIVCNIYFAVGDWYSVTPPLHRYVDLLGVSRRRIRSASAAPFPSGATEAHPTK